MVKGFESFQSWFQGYEQQYTIIGGTACDLYYTFLRGGNVVIDGVTVLGPAHLIPFKAKAWLDLSLRKKMGESVDSKNIRKHKNDIFRLTDLLNSEMKVATPQAVINDVHEFVERMKKEPIDLKQLGIVGRQKEEILDELEKIYR
jgi:hypothetical protein